MLVAENVRCSMRRNMFGELAHHKFLDYTFRRFWWVECENPLCVWFALYNWWNVVRSRDKYSD